jgi:hypothetical protein
MANASSGAGEARAARGVGLDVHRNVHVAMRLGLASRRRTERVGVEHLRAPDQSGVDASAEPFQVVGHDSRAAATPAGR